MPFMRQKRQAVTDTLLQVEKEATTATRGDSGSLYVHTPEVLRSLCSPTAHFSCFRALMNSYGFRCFRYFSC